MGSICELVHSRPGDWGDVLWWYSQQLMHKIMFGLRDELKILESFSLTSAPFVLSLLKLCLSLFFIPHLTLCSGEICACCRKTVNKENMGMLREKRNT